MRTVILRTLDDWRQIVALAVKQNGYDIRHDHKPRERMVIAGTQYYLPAKVDMDLFERVLEAKRDLSSDAKAKLFQIRYEDTLSEMKLMGEKIA